MGSNLVADKSLVCKCRSGEGGLIIDLVSNRAPLALRDFSVFKRKYDIGLYF